MHLSAKQFAEIVERFVPDADDRTFAGSDKRRSARVEFKNRATIVPHRDGQPGEGVGVEVRDFSPRGIRFLHSEPLAAGEQFVLELPQQTGDPVRILCGVVHSKPTDEGPFSVGAEFTCVLQNGKSAGRPAPAAADYDRIRRSILD